ncbi:MAG: alkaline phosphatase, DedA family [Candidatus Peribacteria bacterium]|nr:alkaline phosphatase, DedA family [Candidatus Peribacteria bacterium]
MLFIQTLFVHLQQLLEPDTVVLWVRQYGNILVFLFAIAEVVPPISFLSPGGLAIITAGALIASVPMAIGFFLSAWAGFFLGNTFFFILGRHYGRTIARHLFLTEKRLQAVDEFMTRYGRVSVFLGQFVGAVRPFIAFIAGTTHRPAPEFFGWMIAGTAAWAGLLISIGFFLRAHLKIVLSTLGSIGILLFLCSILFVIAAEKKIKHEKNTTKPG